ncbi:MAG: ATP-grasp domain-containing protein [Nanoarchaeota archaeon]
MDKYNILITPAGSGMAIAAIRALKENPDIRIITTDTDRLSPGLHLSHKGYIVPSFDDPSYYEIIKNIIRNENIDVIIPALDHILLPFSNRREEFKKLNATVLVSDPKTIMITRDKWITYNHLKDLIPVPRSFIKKEDINIDFPLLLKPRDGSGSVDVHKVESREELDFFYSRIDKPIIQEYLAGKEYTVDCLADKQGNLLLVVPRERIATKSGISVKGKIIKDERIEKIGETIAKSMKFFGPFFFQLKEDDQGIPKLIEINSRIAGGMSLSSFSGPNIHILAIQICMDKKITLPKINYGLCLTRYLSDIFLDEPALNKIEEAPK